MATRRDELWLAVFAYEDGILVRIHVCASPEPKPLNLVKLLSILREGGAILTLADEFPQDLKILQALQKILSLGAIKPDSISGIHWGSDNGHSVHVEILT